MLTARLYAVQKLPSLLARTLVSGTNGSPLLPDMAEGLDPRYFRAFYLSKADKEDEPSLNQDRESAVYSLSIPAQSTRCWKLEVLPSRS